LLTSLINKHCTTLNNSERESNKGKKSEDKHIRLNDTEHIHGKWEGPMEIKNLMKLRVTIK